MFKMVSLDTGGFSIDSLSIIYFSNFQKCETGSQQSALCGWVGPELPFWCFMQLFDYCSVEVDAGADASFAEAQSRTTAGDGMLSYFGCFFQRLARSCKSVRAQNSRGSKTAAFRWGFRFFLGNPGKMDQFRGLETPLSFRYHDRFRHCVVPLKPWYQWHGLGGWRTGMGHSWLEYPRCSIGNSSSFRVQNTIAVSYFTGVYIDTNGW